MRCTASVSPGGQCSLDSRYVVIYGCLNFHIRERPLCDIHTGEWSDRFSIRKWACTDCTEKVEDVILLLAKEVTVEWLNI